MTHPLSTCCMAGTPACGPRRRGRKTADARSSLSVRAAPARAFADVRHFSRLSVESRQLLAVVTCSPIPPAGSRCSPVVTGLPVHRRRRRTGEEWASLRGAACFARRPTQADSRERPATLFPRRRRVLLPRVRLSGPTLYLHPTGRAAPLFGLVAQLVEQPLCKRDVAGSIPAGASTHSPIRREARPLTIVAAACARAIHSNSSLSFAATTAARPRVTVAAGVVAR